MAAGRFISDLTKMNFVLLVRMPLLRPAGGVASSNQARHRYCTQIGVLNHAPNNFFIPVDFDLPYCPPLFRCKCVKTVVSDMIVSLPIANAEGRVYIEQQLQLYAKIALFLP